jgi:hypothetical protein
MIGMQEVAGTVPDMTLNMLKKPLQITVVWLHLSITMQKGAIGAIGTKAERWERWEESEICRAMPRFCSEALDSPLGWPNSPYTTASHHCPHKPVMPKQLMADISASACFHIGRSMSRSSSAKLPSSPRHWSCHTNLAT